MFADKEVAGSIPALELFFSLLFFLSHFYPFSFPFMLAPPFQCSSIFLAIIITSILTIVINGLHTLQRYLHGDAPLLLLASGAPPP